MTIAIKTTTPEKIAGKLVVAVKKRRGVQMMSLGDRMALSENDRKVEVTFVGC